MGVDLLNSGPDPGDERDGPWFSGLVTCRLCGHEQMSLVPVDSEEDDLLTRLECGNCGNMTCEPNDEDDELE